MSTRAPGATASRPAAAVDTPGWNDLPRQQMAAAAQACCAVFRGFEAIRRMQQMAAHQALAHHQALAERLKEPVHPMDLVAIQAEMVRFDVQGATVYWQQLAGAMAACSASCWPARWRRGPMTPPARTAPLPWAARTRSSSMSRAARPPPRSPDPWRQAKGCR